MLTQEAALAKKETGKGETHHLPLVVSDNKLPRTTQDVSGLDISGSEMIELLSMYDPYGFWKFDLETGKVFWSRDVFEIHGMPYKDGSVDLNAAIAAYHPEDAKIVAQLIDETIAKKTGFRFVLRLRKPDGTYKMVKSVCRYRVKNGRQELYGLFSEFQPIVRNISTF